MSDVLDGWEIVIGLEVHAELATDTKMFSGAPNQFGGEPNTNVDPVSLGLPGTLPVLNEKAVELAIRVGLALNCEIRPSIFARKNYFYPDMPKDFQTSQYDQPINVDGWLELADGRRIGIERAHLEEDAGKTSHVGGGGRIHEAGYSLVDYNRAGVPLLEIVGRPDLRSGDDARAYVAELRSILLAVGASDAKMEEGSMRVDCNVSVRREGDTELGTRCEIKNINSLRSLGRAVDYEARRQVDLITAGERVEQQTRHWDEEQGRTHKLRSKEEAFDYRYFPEPDLVPVVPSPAWIDEIRSALPMLPGARRQRLGAAAGSSPADVSLIVERGDDDFAVAAIEAGADGSRVLVHLTNNLADGLGELTPESFASLVGLEVEGALTASQAKEVLGELVAAGGDPAAIAAAKGFEAMDSDELASLVDQAIADHPDDWAELVAADDKARKKKMGFFTGIIMKATKGQADGRRVNELFSERMSNG